MLDFSKWGKSIFVGFFSIFVLFFCVRFVDFFLLKALDIIGTDVSHTDYIAGFNGYRDYVTALTGLLTLIIGATGIGAFVSFKKFRAEEQKVLSTLRHEKDIIIDRRNQLDMFLKIEEARNNLEHEWGFLSAIQLYDEAEKNYKSHYLLYALRGNAYYFAAKQSIGLSEGRETLYFEKAKRDFESAISKNKDSTLAVYGLGQVLFQQALMSRKKTDSEKIDWDGLPPVGKRDLDDRDIEKLKKLQLKPNGDYCGADKALVEKSIHHTLDAIYKGYDEVVAHHSLATMYEAIDKRGKACTYYKKAYKKNNLQSGYQYCYLWLRKKNIEECEHKIAEIVKTLKHISIYGEDFINASYALLLFIYVNTEDNKDDARAVYHHIDQITIENLFYMTKE